jgi:MFS family permease
MGLLIYLKEDTNIPSWIFLSLIAGIGIGILFSAQGFAAQSSVASSDLAFSGAMYSFFRALGQTLGVAIAGVIFQNTFKLKLEQTAYSAYANAWSSDASAFVQVVKNWSSHGEEGAMKTDVVQAYVESLRMIWIVMCILASFALILSLIFIKELSLEKELDTDQGFRYDHDRKAGDPEASASS